MPIEELLQTIDNFSFQLNKLRMEILELSQMHSIKNSTHQLIAFRELLDDWPEAVPQNLLCDQTSESDKISRAEAILEIIQSFNVQPKNKTCLDYGCGEGHLVKVMKNTAKFSYGYEIGDNKEEIEKHAPYDIVVLYDVLDHAINEKPVNILNNIKKLIHKKSIVFIRFHPWCCRHGAHLYQKINKAFVQLFFSKEELIEMGCEIMPTIEIIYPIRTYKQWIKDAGFQIINHKIDYSPLETFFQTEPFIGKIKEVWGTTGFNYMQTNFADVVLSL